VRVRPVLGRIFLYPIKGLDPVEVKAVKTTPRGSLEYDRRLALFDREGNVISGKREKRIHLVRSVYDLERGSVRLVWGGETCTFSFEDREAMGEFFSWVLGYRAEVRECLEGGFPDDRKAHGPTVG